MRAGSISPKLHPQGGGMDLPVEAMIECILHACKDSYTQYLMHQVMQYSMSQDRMHHLMHHSLQHSMHHPP